MKILVNTHALLCVVKGKGLSQEATQAYDAQFRHYGVQVLW